VVFAVATFGTVPQCGEADGFAAVLAAKLGIPPAQVNSGELIMRNLQSISNNRVNPDNPL